jgi:phage-related protein
MKRVEFLGDALVELRKFPEAARKEAGVQLHKVQMGPDPSDWKPMATVGAGVREIRIRDEAGAFRVLYVAKCR